LEQSIAAKKRAGDTAGRVGALFARGSIAIASGGFEAAYTWFKRAAAAAEKWQMQHTRALALSNMANALVDQGRPRAALPLYATATTISEQEGYPDALALAVGGAAMASIAMKRYEDARTSFLRLRQVREEMGEHEGAVVALHDVGCCLFFQKKPEEARQVLQAAYDAAVQHGVTEWIYRCAKDIALTYVGLGDPDRPVALLREAAANEAKHQRPRVSAKLWESVAALLEQRAHTDPGIEDALGHAVTTLGESVDTVDERLRLLAGLFQHRWDSSRFEQAIDALRTRARIARSHNKRECESRTNDQIGMCLQQLGNVVGAIPLHRQALRIARALPDSELAENCLNNLGEGLRKSGRAKDALAVYLKAESLAQKRGDVMAELSIANNRALVLEDLGLHGQAARVLRRCRDVAHCHEDWDLYVRALHGLANHEWRLARVDDAIRQYGEVFREAKRRGLADQVVAIAINYANALQWTNKKKQALRVLQSVGNSVADLPDAHEYYFYLGTTAADAGDHGAAKDALLTSMQSAAPTGNSVACADAASALADMYQKNGEHDQSDALLKQALGKALPTDRRVALLIQRLRILLNAGKSRPASRLFKQIERLCESEGLKEQLVDTHMLLGDHEWDHGKSKAGAMKAYIAALVPAWEIGLDVVIQTGAHAIQRLLTIRGDDVAQQIERIIGKLEAWLDKQVGFKDIDTVRRVLLWPVRIGLRIAGEPKGVALLSEARMVTMLREEILGPLP
jgi:tetratricopeptide (TPR) repeat protein